jgi:glycosyltransferase involved in cell wall biosynthesis
VWSRFFKRLSQVAYRQAESIVTLSEVNREKQLADGADASRTSLIPNGVDVDALAAQIQRVARGPGAPLRVGFVGRVVPIKDVITFIKACDLALRDVRLTVDIIGPAEEDPAYAARCRELVTTAVHRTHRTCAQLRLDAIPILDDRPDELHAQRDVQPS